LTAVRPFNAFRLLLVIVMGLGSLLTAAGCGATKKPGLTIEQRLEKAEQEKTPDRQAAALLRVAARRSQRSSVATSATVSTK
jgi:hypothetical protein